jgi:hypothetical protein
MKNQFEDDELLAKLSKAVAEPKAPKLSETIIHSAVSTELNYGPRKLATPRLLVNLVGGALILGTVFVLTSTGGIKELSNQIDGLSGGQSTGEFLLAQGDTKISEQDLLDRKWGSLSKFGQSAVGNYVSNRPSEYVDEMWRGQGGYDSGGLVWVFAVTDAVYVPNQTNGPSLSKMFSEENMKKYSAEIASRSDADGIRLLIQGSNDKLYPLVIPENNQPGSFYNQVLEKLEGDTFTKVPSF